jgi:hypothetical protein
MRVGARRWGLRQGPRSYGAQQLRKLRNARKGDEGTPSASVLRRLFFGLVNQGNKSWVRPVPAAAVTPAAQVVAAFIGPKAFVAGHVSLQVNRAFDRTASGETARLEAGRGERYSRGSGKML